MRKTIVAIATMAVLGMASAADFVSVGVDANQSRSDKSQHATVETIRAGKDIGAGFDVVIQDRTQVQTQGGMYNSIEGTLGFQASVLNVYAGLGRDQGLNAAKDTAYNYGLVGGTLGSKVGPVYAFAGAKTHANWDKDAPKQTVAYTGVSYPVTKSLAVELNASASFQDIKDKQAGVAARVSF